jgi:RNA polymerase sigma factor (sigma-70 family)
VFIIEDLVKKAKEGDAAALGEIMDKYKYLIMKEAAKYHICSYEFEDLVQHGYLSVIKAVHQYRIGSNSFHGYLISAIKNNYKALLKGKIKHLREIPDNTLLDLNTNNYELTIEDQIIAYQEVEKLYKALDKLQPQEKEIVERFYIIEDSLKEIACDCNIKYYTAVKMKEAALKKLRELI